MMTQPAPNAVTIPLDQLRALHQDAFALAVLAGSILEECGIDLTGPTPSRIPSPADIPDADVPDIAVYRSRRQAVQR